MLQSLNRLFVLLKLVLQHLQALLQDGHRAAFQPMRDEWRAIEMQEVEVKGARGRQRFQLARRFVFASVLGEIMKVRMQDEETHRELFRRRPIVAFVLIAARASVDQIVKIIRPAGRAWPVMINGQFRADRSFGHATVAAAIIEGLAHWLVQRMRHSNLKPEPFAGEREILLLQLRRLLAQESFLLRQFLIARR